jgi:bacterial/archaeal transporter family-2 protein
LNPGGGEPAVVDKWVAVIITCFAGALVAMQAPINSGLGKSVGTFAAASVSFAVGATLLVLITVTVGSGFGDVGEARHLNWYWLTGGALGAAYVTTVLVSVRELGAGGVTAATIAGQLSMSVALDRAGVLGLPEKAVTVPRVVGVLLLAAGVYLIVRD